MALVDEHQRILRQIIQQRRRRLARQPSGEVAAVVLDAVAVADLLDHLQVEERALMDALRLQQSSLPLEQRLPSLQLVLDRFDRLLETRPRHDEVRLRINRQAIEQSDFVSGQRIECAEFLDIVSPELDAISDVLVSRMDFDRVAVNAKTPALEIEVVAFVENLDQLRKNVPSRNSLAGLEQEQHAVVGFRRTQTVDAGDGRNDQHVAPLEQRTRGRKPHAVDLIVDRRFLLDVGVGRGDVGLGLVVVVVADEILDGVLRKETSELLIELRRKRLVVGQNERRTVQPLDDLRHREGLAGTRDAEQHLMLLALPEAADQLLDCRRLIAARRIGRHQLEIHNRPL